MNERQHDAKKCPACARREWCEDAAELCICAAAERLRWIDVLRDRIETYRAADADGDTDCNWALMLGELVSLADEMGIDLD